MNNSLRAAVLAAGMTGAGITNVYGAATRAYPEGEGITAVTAQRLRQDVCLNTQQIIGSQSVIEWASSLSEDQAKAVSAFTIIGFSLIGLVISLKQRNAMHYDEFEDTIKLENEALYLLDHNGKKTFGEISTNKDGKKVLNGPGKIVYNYKSDDESKQRIYYGMIKDNKPYGDGVLISIDSKEGKIYEKGYFMGSDTATRSITHDVAGNFVRGKVNGVMYDRLNLYIFARIDDHLTHNGYRNADPKNKGEGKYSYKKGYGPLEVTISVGDKVEFHGGNFFRDKNEEEKIQKDLEAILLENVDPIEVSGRLY